MPCSCSVARVVLHPEGRAPEGAPPEVDLALVEFARPVEAVTLRVRHHGHAATSLDLARSSPDRVGVQTQTSEAADDLITYTIDETDRIIAVNQAWSRFAMCNGGGRLAPAMVTGRLLWDLIPAAGPLYAPILHAVRHARRIVRLEFRCDAPSLRRLLELSLVPGPRGQVEFRVRPLRLSARSPVALLADDTPRTADRVVVCSWCKRVNVEVEWLEVEQALQRLRLFHHTVLPQVSHGVCPRCAEALLEATHHDVDPWVTLPESEGA